MPTGSSAYNELMIAGRVTHNRGDRGKAKAAYASAGALARSNAQDAKVLTAEAAVLEVEQRLEEAQRKLQEAVHTGPPDDKSLAYFFLGSVQRGQKDFAGALESFQRGTAAGRPWDAWSTNNSGDLHELIAQRVPEAQRTLEEEKARRYFAQAVTMETAGHDIPRAYVHRYNLARSLLKLGQTDEALGIFEAALEAAAATPSDRSFCGLIGRDLGTTLFVKAVGGSKDAAATTGTVVKDTASFRRAMDVWEQAIVDFLHLPADPDDPDEADDLPESIANLKERAAVVEIKLKYARLALRDLENPNFAPRVTAKSNAFEMLCWSPPNAIRPDGYSSPEERMVAKMASTREDSYNNYWAEKSEAEKRWGDKPVLAILRDWSSSLPLVERCRPNAQNADQSRGISECRGGGYFLRWRGKGLVIDPGLDFLRNFHQIGFHFSQINGIVVSHNHPDHNADLKSLDDLGYELYTRAARVEQDAWSCALILDKNTEAIWNAWHPVGQEAIHFTSKDSFKIGNQRGNHSRVQVLDLLQDCDLPFRIHYFKADHSGDVPAAVGFTVECIGDAKHKAVWIGFSCDTRFSPRLCEESHLKDRGILIAHISQPDDVELLIPGVFKTGPHLGYRGVERLIKECCPGMTLIGEFWGGVADMRLDIADGLKRACGTDRILASSIGLLVNPTTHKVRCGRPGCGNWVAPTHIQVSLPDSRLGSLEYRCHHCASMK